MPEPPYSGGTMIPSKPSPAISWTTSRGMLIWGGHWRGPALCSFTGNPSGEQFQGAGGQGLAELGQGAALDLADPLLGHAEDLADLLQRLAGAVPPEAEMSHHHRPLTLTQQLEGSAQGFAKGVALLQVSDRGEGRVRGALQHFLG